MKGCLKKIKKNASQKCHAKKIGKNKKLKYFLKKNGSQFNIKCHHQDFTIKEAATTITCQV
jgi:hypothetical protein